MAGMVLARVQRAMARLKVCDKGHGTETNAAHVYAHHGSVRVCIRLKGADRAWVYDPAWEQR